MHVVILEPLGVDQKELLAMMKTAVGNQVELTYYDTRSEDIEVLIERSRDADAVVLSNFKYPRAVMEHCPKLKYICVAFTGYDHVDMEYCREKGITVSNCAGYSTAAVAELVFGLLIGLYRNISACDSVVRKEGTKDGLVGPELEGKKFGIIGAGAIGLRTAKIAQAFGCEVLAYSRTEKTVEGIRFVDLTTLLKESDVVSLHVPQNPSTIKLIGRKQLALMKKTAVLINTARGPVVDSEALAEALNKGIIAGAGIDVFEVEPPVPANHPLLNAKNCLCTPHVAFATHGSMKKRAVIVAENLKAYLAGTPVNLV